MKIIYRGDQEALISKLSSELDVSPTKLLYTLAKTLADNINSPIATLAVQELHNGTTKEDQ